MTTKRGWTVALVGAAVAGVLGACGASGGDPMAGCSDASRSAADPGDAEPMLILGSATLSPTIVYSDGAVVIPNAAASDAGADAAGFLRVPMMMPGYHGDQPGGFQAGWLSDCELEVVTELADDLFSPGVDFGDPQVTDMGSTSVTYAGVTVSIYAFSRSNDEDWGLSGAQRQARADLAELWDAVESSAELTGEVEIDRLFLTFYGSIGDDEVTDWPLATPVSELSLERCVTVSDPAQVAAMLARLDEDEELLEDSDWRLAVVAAAPGIADCEG